MLLQNSCEGTPAANVSTTNTAGPDQFDVVTISGTGNSITFNSTNVHSGSTSIYMYVGPNFGSQHIDYTTSLGGTPTTLYGRCYYYFEAYPSSPSRIMSYLSGSSLRSTVNLIGSNKLNVTDSSGTTLGTTTNIMPLNQWVRLEYDIVGDPTNGSVAMRFYLSADSVTPDDTLSYTTQNTGGNINTFRIGPSSGSGTNQPFYVDDIAVGDTGPIGPSTLTGYSVAWLTA